MRRQVNKIYARAAVRDCIMRGESPIASHLLLTQRGILDDGDEAERLIGIRAGHAWTPVADAVVLYSDLGVSSGMLAGLEEAKAAGVTFEWRSLPEWRSLRAARWTHPDPIAPTHRT